MPHACPAYEPNEPEEHEALVDPCINILIHVIKQTADDYRFGKTCRIKDVRKYRSVQFWARDAKEFIDRKEHGLADLWRIMTHDGDVHVDRLKRAIESSDERLFHFEKRLGRAYSRMVPKEHVEEIGKEV